MDTMFWDQHEDRLYEIGIDYGILYPIDSTGKYSKGFVWNGLTSVVERNSAKNSNPIYANNKKYINLKSIEDFGGTIEAFSYPKEFYAADGTAEPILGVTIYQQLRKPFGLMYRTRIGNDIVGYDYGYKLHLIYGAVVAPSKRSYKIINASPEAVTLSWEISTTPIKVGNLKPLSTLVIDSTKVNYNSLMRLQDILFGTFEDPRLPYPDEIMTILSEIQPVDFGWVVGVSIVGIGVVN